MMWPQDLFDEELVVLLTDGREFCGQLHCEVDSPWLRCDSQSGTVWLKQEQIAAIGQASALAASSEKPKKTKAASNKSTARPSAGRPWLDDDLKLLANAFMDNVEIPLLATEFNRTRAAIKQMRLGFECARGNLDEDQVDEVARSWIHRWQQVLAG